MIAEPEIECAPVVAESQYASEIALVQERMSSDFWKKINQVEQEFEALPAEMQQEMPLNHIFTPGLYVREVCMRKGSLVISRIHLTEHPFVISAGVVSVLDDDGWKTLRSPFTGVTKPGTRRILLVHEDTIFSTFHVTNETDPDEIVRQVTFTDGKYAQLGAAAKNPNERLLR